MESEDQELSNVSEEDFANLDSSSESSRHESVQSSEDESDPSTRADSKTKSKKQKKQVKKTKKMSKPKITFNVSDTQYDVVKYVGKKLFKWKLTYDKESMDWDIMWTDNAVLPETLARMQTFQKINHFPGMYSLARKNHLGRNLMRMKKVFPEQYKFFPQTFLLPSEYNEFRMQFTRKKAKTFIVKPEASCQGRGIFLTRTFESVQPGEHYVAQRYLHKPYLIDGLKFDMRIYVLLAGCDPLKIYLYDDGLGRFATEEYVAPTGENLDNVCMHLTNYAINKDNPNFVFNESSSADDVGHKRSLKAVFKTLKEEGHDVDLLWKEIRKIIIKTFCSVQPILAHSYKSCHPDEPYNNMCFELLGFDVMLDHKLKPWLIEVNHTPSFTTDTPLDKHIKKSAIRDALRLMNISVENRTKAKNKKRAELQQRVLTGKKVKVTPEEKQAAFEKAQRERNTWEAKNYGRYTKIYPFDDPAEADEDYEEFMRVANKWWEEWTGTSVKRVIKKPVEPNKPPPMVFGQGPGPSNMSTRAKDIQSIYSQKLKAGPKPGSVQSQRPTQGYSSPNNKPSTATQNFRSPNKGQWNENNENLEVPMVGTRELDEENKDFMNHLAAISEVEGTDVLAEDYEEDWNRINDPRRSLQAQPQSQAIHNKMRTTTNSQEKWIRKDIPMKETGSLLLTNDARLAQKYETRMTGTKGPSFRIKYVNAPKESPQKTTAEKSQTDNQKFHFSKKFAHYMPSETLEDPNAVVSTQGDVERGLDGRSGKEKETNVRKTPLKMSNGIVGTIGMVSEAHWNQAGSIMSVDMDAETRNMSAAGISRNGDLRTSTKKPTLTAYQPMKLPKNNMAPKLYEMTVSIKEDGPVRSTVSNSFGLSLQGLGVGNKGTGFAPNQSNQKVSEINLNYFHDSQITMQRYYNFYTRGKK